MDMIGRVLGHYRVTAALGAGGMGEVYRATDTKLGREVAIKVLPAAFAQDADRVARFRREAHVLAALNHTNVAAIHGLEEADGVTALVMELAEGDDLARRLTAGPLPVDEALAIARQVADALAEAHDKGIVHRDLKPANLKVGHDGKVKVLDFGLARAMTPESAPGSAPDLSQSPTLARGGTESGLILGTAAYMSPEQARGRSVDRRADMWSFGVVLWEMLTGRPLFAGETVSDVLAAVITREVDWSALPPLPAPALRLLRRCLERDRNLRLDSASVARLEIEEALHPSPAAPAARSSPGWKRRAVVAWALIVTGFLLFLAGRMVGQKQAAGIESFVQVTDAPGIETTPALSPDGKSIVYARLGGDDGGLYLQRIGSRTARKLSPDAAGQDLDPAFSPDGERIAFRSERDGGGIFLMDATGESITRLAEVGHTPSWSPDGKEVVLALGAFQFPTDIPGSTKDLLVVNAATGARRVISTASWALQPAWSPHGGRIAYMGLRAGGQRDLWTLAADGSDKDGVGVSVTDDAALDWSPTWSPDGRYLYFASTRGGTMNLWRVRLDEVTGRPLAEPEPMTAPAAWLGHLSFSRDGSRVAYAARDWRSNLFRVAFDPVKGALTGVPEPILRGTRPIRDHQLSPDGQWVAFSETGTREDLFVARVDGSQYRRLTDDAFRDRAPTWSPDGRQLAFYSDRSGKYEAWAIAPDGSGLRQVTEGASSAGFVTWSPDGKQILYGGPSRLFLVPADATKARPSEPEPEIPERSFFPFSWSGHRLVGPAVRPDGTSPVLHVYDIVARRYTEIPGPLARADGLSWMAAAFLPDGRRLVVWDPGGLRLVDADTGEGGTLLALPGFTRGRNVGLSRDGRFVTYTETASEGDIWLASLSPER